MNPYLKIKKHFATRRINKQIKQQILMVKMQKALAESSIEKMSIESQFMAVLICGFLPLKGILRSMLANRRRIIKSLNK